MREFSVTVLICALLAIVCVSCEKIASEGTTTAELTAPLTELPASYGSLVAVTAVPEYPGWFQLWFEDEAGTIRIVRVQMIQNLMHKQIKTINRTPDMQEEVSENEG